MKEILAGKVGCITAVTLDGYIGYENDLMIAELQRRLTPPEKILADVARQIDISFFADITKSTETAKKAVIMGRKTWESLPKKYRPLPNRINVVITSDAGYSLPEGVLKFTSIGDALETVEVDEAWLIGGAGIYDEAVNYAQYVIICRFEFSASDTIPAIELKKYGVMIPEWMKNICDHSYILAGNTVLVPNSRHSIDVYSYTELGM